MPLHQISIPLNGPRTLVRLADLAYERLPERVDLPAPAIVPRPRGMKAVVRSAIDWETVTPLAELPAGSFSDKVKKGLRWWRQAREEAAK